MNYVCLAMPKRVNIALAIDRGIQFHFGIEGGLWYLYVRPFARTKQGSFFGTIHVCTFTALHGHSTSKLFPASVSSTHHPHPVKILLNLTNPPQSVREFYKYNLNRRIHVLSKQVLAGSQPTNFGQRTLHARANASMQRQSCSIP